MGNAEYQRWIQDPFSWGGETEVVVLATHFGLEVAVITMEACVAHCGRVASTLSPKLTSIPHAATQCRRMADWHPAPSCP